MDWLVFVVCFGACAAAGTTGAAFPPGAWYEQLDRPSWTPPNWLFPLAWTSLYIAMSVAAARVAPLEGAGLAMALWALQIALNALWTPIFFGLRRIKEAIPVVLALWAAVAACMVVMWDLDWVAGALFAPYLLWCAIASALNIAVWRLNPNVEPVNPNA